MQILSNNLAPTLLDSHIITEKIKDNLSSGYVIYTTKSYLFISSFLGLILKINNNFCYIPHFSHAQGFSVNKFLSKKTSNLQYISFKKVIDIVLQASRHCITTKKDIKNAFCNIPIAFHIQWLFGFT